MTEKEAVKQGLIYTGISYPGWNTTEKEKNRQRVSEIKKAYKCRVVLVKSSRGYESYYGDKAFELAHWNSEESLNKELKILTLQKEKVYQEYLKSLEEIEQKEINCQTKMAQLKEIKRK